MSIRGSVAGVIVGVCLGVIVAAFRAQSRFWVWSGDYWYIDGEAWVVTTCLAIIGCIVGGVIGSRFKDGK